MSFLKSSYDTRNVLLHIACDEFYSGHQLKDFEDITEFTKDSIQYPESQPSTLCSH